jgi:hypothetical protein
MKIEVFAEFAGWAVLDNIREKRTDLQIPTKESLAPTKLLGKEKADDEILRGNMKLFYTKEEADKVDEVVAFLESSGFKLEDKNPYRENIIDAATNQIEREYCNDRVIFSFPL